MSNYTIQLRFICETLCGLKSSTSDYTEVIENSYTKLFDSDIQCYNANYTSTLLKKIINHFYFREVSAETMGQFRFYLNQKMREIMPRYNELYKLQSEINNEFIDVTESETVTGNSETSSNSENVSRGTQENTLKDVSKFSDTPQNLLSNVENGRYLTTVNIDDTTNSNTNESTDTSTGTASATNTSTRNKNVRTTNQIEIYNKYQKMYNNIDLDIINDLEELFLQVW